MQNVEALWEKVSREPPLLLSKMQMVFEGNLDSQDQEQVFLQKQKIEDPKWFLGQQVALEKEYQKQLQMITENDREKVTLKERILSLEQEIADWKTRYSEGIEGEVDEGTGRAKSLLDQLQTKWKEGKSGS